MPRIDIYTLKASIFNFLIDLRVDSNIVLARGATAIKRWTPCSCTKTSKKGSFSQMDDVREYSAKGIKMAKNMKKGYTFYNSLDACKGLLFY